ncbi:unnamed protein product, partial [Coregonus sp. 'balchen']
ASLSVWGWGGLGVVLFLITFGPFAIFYLAFYICCVVGGGFAVTLLFGKTNSERHLEKCEHSYLPATQTGILKTLDEMRLAPKPIKIDRRLTGSNYIDEPLQQVIQFALRDYIQYWYYTLSEDESFLLEIRQTVQNALVQFSTRSKDVDWQPYFTTRLVDDFATHLREILARGVLLPLVNQLSDPDYINQFVIWMAVKDKALEELQYLRSLDTAGDDYMQAAGAQAELFFWLTVEGYRVTAQQQLEVMEGWQKDGKKGGSTKGLLKAAALGVYEQYLSDKASPRVQVDEMSVVKLREKLQKDGDPTPEIFDDIQRKVYDMMLRDERYYPSFRQSPLYIRMLAELDMLKEPSYRGSDDGDGEMCGYNSSGLQNVTLSKCIDAVRSLDAVLSPNTTRRQSIADACLPGAGLGVGLGLLGATGVCNDHGKTYALYAITVCRRNHDGSEDSWKTYRRYSDFHDFHMRITEQLPGKKTFNNMDRDFLEKRKKDLNAYLQVPPLLPKSDIDPEHCRVSAQLDDNVDDNIPLRVMLLLMDEVFDLKERNQWLRRNIKNLLQQLIRATYGDTINRKIVDHVDFMTAPEQVADYVKKFRDSYWPNGILAESPPRRDKNIRMRTRVAAKTNLLGIMPDELKHIIGADTTRKGILRVFDMFQHGPMNRRLVYVLLEGFLETMFPQYKFPELFVKLHSRSPRTARYTQKLKSTSLKRHDGQHSLCFMLLIMRKKKKPECTAQLLSLELRPG